MGKLFVMMGKSATGKDTIFHEVMNRCPALNQVISYTTRPIRAGETHGKEYFFCSQDELYTMESENKVIECREYDTVHGPWFYFTADDGRIDLNNNDYLMISTVEGYEKIRRHFGRKQTVPIYIEVEDFERLDRSLKRERQQRVPCVAEVCRRYLADEADFSEEKLELAGINKIFHNRDLQACISEVETFIKNYR